MTQVSLGNIPDDPHPSIEQVVDYWRAIHPDNGLPGRQHFDPLGIPNLLGNIGLIDVHGRPPRFQFRVAGNALDQAYGTAYTGKWYDELFANFEQTDQYRDLCHVLEHREPHWRHGRLRLPAERDFQALERVHLPMARDGTLVDMILMFVVFFEANDPFIEKVGQLEAKRSAD